MTVRVGVVGTGFGRRVVAPVFAATDGCVVVDIVSARDAVAVDALCHRPDVDLVSVHSPPFLHAAHVRAALDAGHAVLCDKPFALSAAEGTELLAEAEGAGVTHLVNFEFRLDPVREHLRALIAAGAVGQVEHVQWTHLSSGSRVPLRPFGWLFERALGGGWIGAWGSHAIDLLRWTFGEVAEARARLRTAVPERPDPDGTVHRCDAEDGFSAWLTVGSGVTVTIDSSFAAPASLASRLVVGGSDGLLECVADQRITLRRADGTREEFERPTATADPHLVPMRRWAEVARDAVVAGTAPEGAPTFADGVACDRVLDQLRAPTRD